jgi:flagellin
MSGSLLSINTNLGAMAALETLNATQQSLNTTQNAVSTGLSVSQASDNPAIYAIGQTMQANISALTAVQNNLSFGQSTLGVASNAAQQISSQLASLQQTVTQADQAGISPTTMQQQANSLLTNIDQFANTANFNGVNLLNGASNSLLAGGTTLNIVQDTSGNTIAVSNQNATTTGLGLSGLSVTGANVGFAGIGNEVTAAGDTFKFTATPAGGTATTYTFTFAAGQTNGTPTTGTGGVGITVGLGSSQSAAITNLVSAIDSFQGSVPGTQGLGTTNQTGQLFSAALDSQGNLTIATNSPTTALSAGAYTPATGTTTDTAIAGTAGSSAQQAILIVQNAIGLMNTKSATLGSAEQQVTGLQNFNSQLSNSFTSGLGALTDANMAAESAQLQSLQTKQQLAIRSLSIANAQPQSLLNLFP